MKSYLAVLVLLPCCLADGYGHDNYGTHNSGYGDPYGDPYGKDSRSVHSSGYGHSDPYGNPHGRSYSHGNSGYGYKKKNKCYQCSYSPDKTYYRKVVKYISYPSDPYDHHSHGYGYAPPKPKGYYKETVVPVTVKGGWDKCKGPFTDYEAHAWGIDEWDCDGKCYVRRDKNGDIVRGCYKGEYGVDPYRGGCQKAGGSTFCFCEGPKCNKGPAPKSYHPVGYH